MGRKLSLLKYILCVSMLTLLLLPSGCVFELRGKYYAGMLVYLDSPPDGAEIPLGSEVPIVAHATHDPGVSIVRMVLLINDREFTELGIERVAENMVESRFSWRPPSPGNYTITVKGFCQPEPKEGGSCHEDRVKIKVLEVRAPTPHPIAMATPTPTSTPTQIPSPTPRPTPTFTPTRVPSPTPRPTPTFTPMRIPSPTPTFTPTPLPPVQVNFWADRTTIVRGECTTLHWDVEYATAVYLNGEGVVGHASRNVCPQSTTTFTLRVVAPGGDVYRSITITVLEPTPSDTTGPSIPYLNRSGDRIMWPSGCPASRLTISAPVSDPSGVSGVKLIYRVSEGRRIGSWQNKGMTMVGTDYWSVTIEARDLELSLNPPLTSASSEGTLEIYLLAYDNLGNKTQTNIVTFKVLYCVW